MNIVSFLPQQAIEDSISAEIAMEGPTKYSSAYKVTTPASYSKTVKATTMLCHRKTGQKGG